MNIYSVALRLATVVFSVIMLTAGSLAHATDLDNSCVINILNRTIQVSSNGGWSLPNIPSTQGRIRARATCTTPDGLTISGQSDYFTVTANGISEVGEIVFQELDPIPTTLRFSSTQTVLLNGPGDTASLSVIATYANGTSEDVSSPDSGINYTSSNPVVATVDESGGLTAQANGLALIFARKDGVMAVRRVTVSSSGDGDGDGIPDDVEVANGLNPNDPVDALEDQDSDGISALDEYNLGTDINSPDTDGDGIQDGEEIAAGADGYVSDPLLVDTDGDGLSDPVEVAVASNPSDPNDHNYDDALINFSATPSEFSLINNTILPDEIGQQLSVTGEAVDGTVVDLTSSARGTSYSSSDLSVCNFGLESGLVYGSSEGSCLITVRNGDFENLLSASVFTFDPMPLSVLSIPGYANNIDVAGDFGFVAAGSAGLVVVGLGDRANPSIAGSVDTDGTSIDVKVGPGFAYLADGSAGLKVVDIAAPETPVIVGGFDTPGLAQDLQVLNGLAYLADGASGLQIVDISNAAEPVFVGQVNGIGEAKGVDVQGNIAAVGTTSGLYLIDVANPEFPVVLGNEPIANLKDVVIEGNYAHVAALWTGYLVVDISNPTSPAIVSQGSGFVPRDVAITGNLALYAEQGLTNAIAAVNIREPDNAVYQSVIDMSGFGNYAGTGVALDQQHVYVTSENSSNASSDYGSSGTTALMIAQFRQIEDNEGIAPQVSLLEPAVGQSFIQGESITVTVDASDDIFVASVELLIDDVVALVDSGAPYQFRYPLPSDGLGELSISARAIDLGGNSAATEPLTINVTIDPGTDVIGRVIDADMFGVASATVNCLGQTSLTDSSGEFSIAGVPTVSAFNCNASVLIDGTAFNGLSGVVTPVRDGTTDVGDITVRSAFFDSEYGTNLFQSDDDYDFVSFGDGFQFPFFGQSYSGVYINSNGRLSFEFGDSTYTESFERFTSQPNIAAFFDDLHPGRAGGVYYKQEADRFVVTWDRVPQYSYGGENTIQMTLFADGRISFGYNGVTARGAFVGLSDGESLGATALDWSAAPFFVDQPVSIYELFLIGSSEFDIDGNFILFTPVGEGFDIDLVPLQ